MNVDNQQIKKILQTFKKITIIGLSPDAQKPSHSVPRFMQNKGYDIVGVYPKKVEIEGFKIYQKLSEVPVKDREFINIFRKPEAIPEIIDEVLMLGGTKILWLQLGISQLQAEKKAETAGIQVVSNRCLLIEFNRMQN